MFWLVSYFYLDEILNLCTDQHSYLLCISTNKPVFQPANQCSAHRLMVEIICFCFFDAKTTFSVNFRQKCMLYRQLEDQQVAPPTICMFRTKSPLTKALVLLRPFLDQTNTIKVSTKLQTKQFISKYV